VAHRTDVDTDLLALFAKLCSRVPDADERADLLGVSPEVQAAWKRGPRCRFFARIGRRSSAQIEA
jgi:hypothetical protein